VERLGDLIAEASTIVPFTGAGISTETGIPDFRSPGGLWTRNRPIPFDEFVASQDARDEAWRRRFAMEPTFAAAIQQDPSAAFGAHRPLTGALETCVYGGRQRRKA